MDNVTAVRQLISTVHHKLREEIGHLQRALQQIDHLSDDPAEQWAHKMYTRLLERRRRMLDRLVAEAV